MVPREVKDRATPDGGSRVEVGAVSASEAALLSARDLALVEAVAERVLERLTERERTAVTYARLVPDTPRRETRTSRAEAWVARRVREAPGHVTLGTRLYAAYRAWAQREDPEGPLSYTAFVRVVDSAAPVERRVRVMTARGRPQLAFVGIVLTRSRSGFPLAASVE